VPAPMEMRIADGELLFRGPNVFKGYRTSAGVDVVARDGWVHSGDLGELAPDGQLRLAGRSNDMIIRGGHNIDPAMIEEAALAHPDVLLAAAVSMPDSYAGEIPALFVVLRIGADAGMDEIEAFVAARIAEPPARPRLVSIVSALPMTPVGKIAKYKLRQLVTVHKSRELLDQLPFDDVLCTDPAGRRVTVTWLPEATTDARDEGHRRIERLGLSVEPPVDEVDRALLSGQ
jgi:fatty-acyl-CoA synthase